MRTITEVTLSKPEDRRVFKANKITVVNWDVVMEHVLSLPHSADGVAVVKGADGPEMKPEFTDEALRRLFDASDINQSGVLTFMEFGQMLNALGGSEAVNYAVRGPSGGVCVVGGGTAVVVGE